MLKRRSIFWVMMVMLLSAVLFAACGAEEAPTVEDSSDDTIVWEMLDINVVTNPAYALITEYVDKVYEATDGRLKINVRIPGELPFATDEYLRAVGENSVQMASCMVNAVAGDLKAGGLLSVPFLVTTGEELQSAISILEPYIQEELGDYGIEFIMALNYPAQDVWGQGTPPDSMQDLQNVKIRTSGAQQAKYFQTIGAVPTSIDGAEVVSALNKNVINGACTAALTIHNDKWHEELDWGYLIDVQLTIEYVIVNDEALDALPDDVREIFLQVSRDFQKDYPDRMQAHNDASIETLKTELGMTIIEPDEEEMRAQLEYVIPIWDDFAAQAGDEAVEALAKLREALDK